MMEFARDLASNVGDRTADFAKKLGTGTTRLGKRIGPVRLLIGFAALGAITGGSIFLVRFLRARAEQAEQSKSWFGRRKARKERREERREERRAHFMH